MKARRRMLLHALVLGAALLETRAALCELAYPPDSSAAAEIDRRLPRLDYLRAFDEAMGAAGDDAEARRAAQLEVLRLVKADPVELFRQLRSERPVLELPDLELYLVVRDLDVREVLHNPTVFSVQDYRDRMEPVVGPYMLNRDSHPYYNIEEKPWMRSLMAPADLPRIRSIARQATAEGIASRTSPDGTLDLVPALGRAVPVRIVQDYFGFRAPTADLLRWSHQTQDSFFHNVPYVRGFRGFLIRTFGLGGEPLQARQREAAEVHHAAFRAGEEMRSFLDDYIAHHSAEILAEDTVLSRMLRVNDSLTHPKEMDRIRSNVMGGLIGAVETSNAAIVQSVHQILRRPDVLARARAAAAAAGDEPAAVAAFSAFVWEALRFHPINPFVVRYVQQDVWIGSGDQAVLLREGRRVLVATHSAMLDPRSVQDPDAFRTDRPERDREMNLGYAMHRCLGDHVAQAMVPEVVRQILLLPDLARVESDPPLELNQGIDFGARGSFPEHYFVRHRVSERAGL